MLHEQLGQALSIRPDILSPAAMNELQKLCDKVPSYDSGVAMQVRPPTATLGEEAVRTCGAHTCAEHFSLDGL